MTCDHAPALTDTQLLMYLDGAIDPEVAMHLSQCVGCRGRMTHLQTEQRRLYTHLFRAACPPSLELAEYAAGLLAAGPFDTVDRHVAGCPHCSAEIAQLKTFLAEPDPWSMPESAMSVGQQIRILIGQLAASAATWAGGTPSMAPALAGVRGSAAGPLVFEAGEAQVVIESMADKARPGSRSILGLVIGLEGAPTTRAHLWSQGDEVAVGPVDDLGNFSFDGLAPGVYELILSGPDSEIHLQQLTLEAGVDRA